MPTDSTATLGRLLQATTIEDHEEILQTASASLKGSLEDVGLLHTKVVALLKLDRFDDALRVIDGGGDSLGKTCMAEKAYALYKTGQFGEAAKSLPSAASDQVRAVSHIGAQVAYRSERFEDARDIYERLTSTTSRGSSDESELAINRAATSAQLAWCGQGGADARADAAAVDDPDTFELAYNAACACIARGRLSEASSLLERAVRLCDNSELSDVEKQVEMLPILTQQGYVHSKRGMVDRASEVYARAIDPGDGDAEAILLKELNSSLLPTTDANPFSLCRKVDEVLAKGNTGAMFSHQRSKIEQLRLVLDMMAQKFVGVEARTQKAAAEQVGYPGQLSVINAVAHAREASEKAVMTSCQHLSKERPLDLGLALCIVQLRMREKNTGAAAAALESYLRRLETETDRTHDSVRFSPGLVALVVSLYRLQGRQQSVRAELAKAAEYYTESGDCPSLNLLREAGLELIKSQDEADARLARAAFEAVMKSIPGDPVAAAGYVACSSVFPDSDNPAGDELATKVPAARDLVSGLSADALLDAGVASSLPAAAQMKRKAAKQLQAPAQKRRRRRLPKDVEPGTKPDPERWLPLRDRSSYRPKGKKGKKKANEATQGGMVKDEETLELVGGAGAVKVEKATNTSSSKKKKSKGRR